MMPPFQPLGLELGRGVFRSSLGSLRQEEELAKGSLERRVSLLPRDLPRETVGCEDLRSGAVTTPVAPLRQKA